MSSSDSLAHSPIWDRIHAGPLAAPHLIDLDSFRSSDSMFAISTWNPERYGLRYLKMMLFTLLARSNPADAELYRQISNRDVGRPITVRAYGVDVCLDYFQAVDEAKTISDGAPLRKSAHVAEIGPGYGRTCHALLSLFPQIGEYWLVDLEPCLVLSKRYLERVLDPALFGKLRFVPAVDFGAIPADVRFDLVINIDSFGDFPPVVACNYLKLIDRHCDAFYCKNPVGKYLDPALGGEGASSERVRQALASGLSRDIIDIFDADAVAEAVPPFLASYQPGSDWWVTVDRSAPPWSYYHQAVYCAR